MHCIGGMHLSAVSDFVIVWLAYAHLCCSLEAIVSLMFSHKKKIASQDLL